VEEINKKITGIKISEEKIFYFFISKFLNFKGSAIDKN